jgi:K+-sensing histidine kinase KdpD
MEPVASIILISLVISGAMVSIAYRVAKRRAQRQVTGTLRAASAVVASAVAAADSVDALKGLAQDLAALFDADACAVVLPDGAGKLTADPVFGFPDEMRRTIRTDEGLVGACFTTGKPQVVPDVDKDPRYVRWLPEVRSLVAVPLRYKERTLGVLNLESSKRRYAEDDLAILVPLADQVAAALENLELRVAAEDRATKEKAIRNDLQAISAVVMAGVASASDLDAALHSMIKEISARLGWESLAVVLYGDDGLLYTRAYFGYPVHSTVIAFTPGIGIIGSVAASGEGRLIPDVSEDPDYLDVVANTRAEMCVPLFSAAKVIGVLNAESPRPHAFDESDFKMLNTLGRQMAVVIERARLADIEREALRLLTEADQLKDDFIATVSHELRTPLTSIKGYAQTLLAREDRLTPKDRSEFLQIMVRHCDRLARIVDTLLLVSRMEAGEVGSKPTYASVQELAKEAIEAAGGEDRVQTEIPSRLGLITDQFKVHHILRNLIENACKYSPDSMTVLVRAKQDEEVVLIEVIDGGDGIPEGLEDRIFQRFQRLSEPGQATTPGTGLGLYIAKRFATDLGGDLWVERATERHHSGARFVLRLPALPDRFAHDTVRVASSER